MSRRLHHFAALLLAFVAAQPALAQEQIDLAKLRSEQLALHPQIEAGKGSYVNIPQDQRERVLARQAELLALIEGKQDMASLDKDQRLEVRNALDALLAAERNAEDQRQICKRTKTLGSHRMTTVCRSVAEIRQQEEEARRSVTGSIGGCANGSSGMLCN